MRKIDNIEQLREERIRLRKEIRMLEEEMEHDFTGIKEYLHPFHLAMNATGKILTRKDAWLFGPGINFVIDMLVGRMLLRKAGWLSRLTVPFLLKNVTHNYVVDHAGTIIDTLKNLFNKFRGKNHQEEIYDRTTAASNY
jgi:hypothetical protein